ncbi:MAG: hypothetical protein M9895_00840 [Aquamicrobium sp.]|uniref:hypothetical protein n=1 Tax=Aquamicrobium sp. TaxID=1872579 RepID=UPI00349E8E4E|nr:hypothetical protein [Aquamicrobium sp.]
MAAMIEGIEAKARALFEDYSRRSNALHDAEHADIDALADVFAGHFVGASPLGVMGGAKDDTFAAVMRQGFGNYRAMGGTRFEIVTIEVDVLDGFHAMVRADWEFDYVRPGDGAAGTIAFRNLYFVSFAEGEPRIFAWITPDEAQAMKDHGLA